MNQNRPFFSTNTNLYDESFRSSAPATLNGQNVILSQEQQRRIYDTLNTAIVGNNIGLNTVYPGNIHVLQAEKQFFPGGVTFSFNQRQQPQPIAQGMCCKCPVSNSVPFDQNNLNSGVNTYFPSALENQIKFGGIQQCGVDYLKYQQQVYRNPFQLPFHNDHSTSCSDLLSHFTQVPASKGYPDLCNINGALQQNQFGSDISEMSNNVPVFFPLPPIEFSSNAKKLVLSKNVVANGHVVDVLEENEKNENIKKRVSFSDDQSNSPTRNDQGSQFTSDCICEAKKCKNIPKKTKKQQNDNRYSTDDETKHGKHEKKKKEKKKMESNLTSSDSTVSSDSEHKSGSGKHKKIRWWNKHQKTDKSDTTDTEAEKSDSIKKERKINKKRKKDNPNNGLKADNDNQQNMSDSSNQQSSTSEHSDSEGAKKCKNIPKKTKKQQNDNRYSTDDETKHGKHEKKKKEKKKMESNLTSSDSTVSSDSEHKSGSGKHKKIRWWNKHQKTDKSDTTDTEAEKSDSIKKERKINKKRKKDNPNNGLKADNDNQQNMSDSSNQQSSTSEHSDSEGGKPI